MTAKNKKQTALAGFDGEPPITYPRSPGEVAALYPPDSLASIHVDDLKRWQEQLHNAFDLGHKAAGGTMIPDSARNMIELAIDRSALDELIDFAEAGNVSVGGAPFSPALLQFFENVSIHRSRK